MNRARIILVLLIAASCSHDPVDEARSAGKTVADFPTASVDIFKGMDGGIELTPDEIKGRNTWLMWTGGNERLWERLARRSFGVIDLLKAVDSRERDSRFEKKGLINEPGFRKAATPGEHGLWLDERAGNAPDGVDPAVYGRSSGVIGLRLFPNPAFDEKAKRNWDASRYYEDREYYEDPELVRPIRVGMTCAICHVAPHPLYPPDDPHRPEWRNLSSTIGNQYWRSNGGMGSTFTDDNVIFHALESARPGTVDTSILATDNNNNPNIINAIFDVGARMSVARENRVSGDALLFPPKSAVRPVPHILVDGADSVGVAAALSRVFVNVGLFSEHWIQCHNPFVGVRKQRPFSVEMARKNSVYWQVTEHRVTNLAKFLVRAANPSMKLADAPGGEKYLEKDQAVVERGKIVFAENCMACHSGKRPPPGIEGPIGDFAQWARSDAFLNWARDEVTKPDFLDDNYLSTDERVPITLLETNASRALQNNAKAGHVWAHFSSDDYKATPSIGSIDVYDPFAKKTVQFEMPGGGPGFYRVPTLIGIWARAPFLHNNALGEFVADPSVAGRMRGFNDAIEKMFWKDKRDDRRSIARTAKRSHLSVAAVHLPVAVEGIVGTDSMLVLRQPWIVPLIVMILGVVVYRLGRRPKGKAWRVLLRIVAIFVLVVGLLLWPLNFFAAGHLGGIELGPFPAGTPINLLTNIDPHAPKTQVARALWKLRGVLNRIESERLSDSEGLALLEKEAAPDLYRLSKSPDWVQDRGHYFAEHLPDSAKRALIAFLKTL